MTQGIEGKVVIITGASSGLGEATARLPSEDGARLALAAELSLGNEAAVQTDVTQFEEVGRLRKEVCASMSHAQITVLTSNK